MRTRSTGCTASSHTGRGPSTPWSRTGTGCVGAPCDWNRHGCGNGLPVRLGAARRSSTPLGKPDPLAERLRVSITRTMRRAVICSCASARSCSGARRERPEDAVRSALPRLPEVEPVEPAGRLAAGRGELGRDRPLDRRERGRARRLRLGALGRRADRDPDHGRRHEAAQDARLASSTPTSPTAARTRSRASVKIEGGRSSTATGTRSSSTARCVPALRALRPATPKAAAGRRALARSGACARTSCVPRAGRRPTPPACRSCPGLARYDEVEARRDRPRAPLHGPAHAARVRLPGAALRERLDRPEPAADGPAPAPEARASTSAASRARRGSCSWR